MTALGFGKLHDERGGAAMKKRLRLGRQAQNFQQLNDVLIRPIKSVILAVTHGNRPLSVCHQGAAEIGRAE
jgi:hypothetical protein